MQANKIHFYGIATITTNHKLWRIFWSNYNSVTKTINQKTGEKRSAPAANSLKILKQHLKFFLRHEIYLIHSQLTAALIGKREKQFRLRFSKAKSKFPFYKPNELLSLFSPPLLFTVVVVRKQAISGGDSMAIPEIDAITACWRALQLTKTIIKVGQLSKPHLKRIPKRRFVANLTLWALNQLQWQENMSYLQWKLNGGAAR